MDPWMDGFRKSRKGEAVGIWAGSRDGGGCVCMYVGWRISGPAEKASVNVNTKLAGLRMTKTTGQRPAN